MNTALLSTPVAAHHEAAPRPLPRDALALVIRLVSGLHDRRAAPLVCSYGAQAQLVVDFATRIVRLDAEAARRLDAHQVLPAIGATVAARPGTLTRDLDDVLWDIGQACRRWQLLGAGAQAWQQALVADPGTPMSRLLRLPLPLALARLMFDADARAFTPADVQHACGLSAEATRGLLQACLFLGLVRWHWSAAESLPETGFETTQRDERVHATAVSAVDLDLS